jgi:hypothetical protein
MITGAVTAPILSIAVYLPRKAPWLMGDILVLPLPFMGLPGQNNSRSLLKSLEIEFWPFYSGHY